MVLCNSKLFVTTGRALASSYDLTRQAWLDLEELRRYLHCVMLVNMSQDWASIRSFFCALNLSGEGLNCEYNDTKYNDQQYVTK